jgi:hypothetical protein
MVADGFDAAAVTGIESPDGYNAEFELTARKAGAITT